MGHFYINRMSMPPDQSLRASISTTRRDELVRFGEASERSRRLELSLIFNGLNAAVAPVVLQDYAGHKRDGLGSRLHGLSAVPHRSGSNTDEPRSSRVIGQTDSVASSADNAVRDCGPVMRQALQVLASGRRSRFAGSRARRSTRTRRPTCPDDQRSRPLPSRLLSLKLVQAAAGCGAWLLAEPERPRLGGSWRGSRRHS